MRCICDRVVTRFGAVESTAHALMSSVAGGGDSSHDERAARRPDNRRN